MQVLLTDREHGVVGLVGKPLTVGVREGAQVHIQIRRNGCVQLAMAEVAQLGNPIFGILRTVSLLWWLLLCQSLNGVQNRTADLIVLSQVIKSQ